MREGRASNKLGGRKRSSILGVEQKLGGRLEGEVEAAVVECIRPLEVELERTCTTCRMAWLRRGRWPCLRRGRLVRRRRGTAACHRRGKRTWHRKGRTAKLQKGNLERLQRGRIEFLRRGTCKAVEEEEEQQQLRYLSTLSRTPVKKQHDSSTKPYLGRRFGGQNGEDENEALGEHFWCFFGFFVWWPYYPRCKSWDAQTNLSRHREICPYI